MSYTWEGIWSGPEGWKGFPWDDTRESIRCQKQGRNEVWLDMSSYPPISSELLRFLSRFFSLHRLVESSRNEGKASQYLYNCPRVGSYWTQLVIGKETHCPDGTISEPGYRVYIHFLLATYAWRLHHFGLPVMYLNPLTFSWSEEETWHTNSAGENYRSQGEFR